MFQCCAITLTVLLYRTSKNGIKKKKFHIHCIENHSKKSLSIPSQLFVLHYHRVAGYTAGGGGDGAIYY